MTIGLRKCIGAALMSLVLVMVVQPAHAAGPALAISMAVTTPQPILADNLVTWEVSWQCSSVDATPCTGARIDITRPPLTVGGSAVGAPGFTTAAFVDTTGAHYVFVDPLPAGSSGTLQLQYKSVNQHTPDGTLLTPLATFSAANADSVQASAGAEIEAATHLAATVRRLAKGEPLTSLDVSYEINVFDASIPNAASPVPGTWSVMNAVVTDTLPAGAQFVSASGGGIYDPATNSVSWPAIDENDRYQSYCTAFSSCLYLTVRYPASTFPADGDPNNPSDEVTSHVLVAGKPYGLAGAPDVIAQASVTHGFAQDTVVSGIFSKDTFTYGSRDGNAIAYYLSWQDESVVPATFTALDRLPCQLESPSGPLVPCDHPGLRLTKMRLTGPVIGAPVIVRYTTNLSNTGSLTLPRPHLYKSPGVDDDIPRAFATDEYVSHFTVDGNLAGGFSQALELLVTVAPDFPDDPATEIDTLRNCAQSSFVFGEFGSKGPFERCDTLPVIPAKPLIYHFKTGTSLESIAPTEARTFSLRAAPCGDRPWRPVFTDLLPANLRYVPGSQTSSYASFPSLGGVAPTFEAIDNYNGSGRQLVRWTWPGGQAMTECQYLFVWFQARVEPGTSPGTYTNQGQFFDASFTNTNTLASNICVYVEEPDVGDLDGDGDTSEYRCSSTTEYTVVETASMVTSKQVRGSYDPDFKAAPAVGLVEPGHPAEYRITVQNAGNLDLTSLVAYDILPFVGDTGVSGTQTGSPRGSQWQPVLAGAVTPPAGATVEYSLSTNPCRGEVISQGGARAAGPAGCVNDWTSTPADYAAVRAIRIDLGATVLAGAESRSVIVPMTAPLDATGIAWNTSALAGRRVGADSWLLPTEPPKVGLAVAPPDLTLAKDDGQASASPGALLTYTLTVRNAGNQRASGVVVSDTLPAYTSFVAAGDGGSFADGVVTWPAFELAGGASATHTVTVQLDPLLPDAVVAITNTAVVADDGQHGLDPLPSNNTASDVDAISRAPATTCRIYALQDAGRSDTQLFTIELPDGAAQPLGPLRPGLDAEALAMHPATEALYLTGKGHGGKDLFSVDAGTGALTRIGRTGFHDVDSLAFRPTDVSLWGWARGAGLIRIDPSTGAGTLVFHSSRDVQDLAWSRDGGQLYAVAGKQLYAYDPAAHKLTRLAGNLPGEVEGLAMRPDGLLALGVDGSTTLYAYDPVAKQLVAGQSIGVGSYEDVEGIAWPASCAAATQSRQSAP